MKFTSVFMGVFLFMFPGKLDDEVAASVFENRGNAVDVDSITHLTSDNFHSAVADSSLTVVLFYLKCKPHFLLGGCQWKYLFIYQFIEKKNIGKATWIERQAFIECSFSFSPPGDAVSMAFLSSFIEVAERLAGKQDGVLFKKSETKTGSSVYSYDAF